MIFDSKKATDDYIVLKWADALILSANHSGQIKRKSFLPDHVFEVNPPTEAEQIEWRNNQGRKIRDFVLGRLGNIDGDLNIMTHELIKYLELVKSHLLNEGYILQPKVNEDFWVLSEKGRLAKELNGHEGYKKYRKSEINLIRNQGKVNNLLILATALAAIMPFLAAWLFSTKVYNTNVLPPPVYRPDIRIDSVWLHQKVDEMIRKKISSQQQEEPTKGKPPK